MTPPLNLERIQQVKDIPGYKELFVYNDYTRVNFYMGKLVDLLDKHGIEHTVSIRISTVQVGFAEFKFMSVRSSGDEGKLQGQQFDGIHINDFLDKATKDLVMEALKD